MNDLDMLTRESVGVLEKRTLNYKAVCFWNLPDALRYLRDIASDSHKPVEQGVLFEDIDNDADARKSLSGVRFAKVPQYEALESQSPILSESRVRVEEPWAIGMSEDFIKGLSKIDKKLMGRILEAMTHVCKDPVTMKGDTVKPLSAELKGLWRYRIGDHRLIYKPNAANRRIDLLAFESRGTIY